MAVTTARLHTHRTSAEGSCLTRALVTDLDLKFLPLADLLAVHENSSESEDNNSVRWGAKETMMKDWHLLARVQLLAKSQAH